MKNVLAALAAATLLASLAACDRQSPDSNTESDVAKARQEASRDVTDASRKAAADVDEAQRKLDAARAEAEADVAKANADASGGRRGGPAGQSAAAGSAEDVSGERPDAAACTESGVSTPT